MRRFVLLPTVFALLCLQLVGAQGIPTVRIVTAPGDDVTPVLYAQKAGLFDKVGLHAELITVGNGTAATTAVLTGQAEIGRSSIMPIANAYAHGIPVELVAPGELYVSRAPNTLLFALKGTTIRSGADLNGKVVSTNALGDLMWLSTHSWIDQTGGDAASVQYVELPTSTILASLQSGRVLAAAATGPAVQELLDTGKVQTVASIDDAIARDFLLTAWFARKDYVDANPDVIDRFCRVMREAASYANRHHEETAPLIAGYWKIDLQTIRRMHRAVVPERKIDYKRDVEPIVAQAKKYHLLDVDADIRGLVP